MQGGPSISICPIDWKSAIRIKSDDSLKGLNVAEKSGSYQDILARNTVFVFKKWEARIEKFTEFLAVVFFDLFEHEGFMLSGHLWVHHLMLNYYLNNLS